MTHRTLHTALWLVILLLTAAMLGLGAAPQWSVLDVERSLFLMPDRATWLLTGTVPDGYRFCAALERDGTLRGCVTAKALRAQADDERRATKKGTR